MKKLIFAVFSVCAACLTMSAQTDYTNHILNPSFEQNGTANWTSVNLVTQSNQSFSKKAGVIYLERWVAQGNRVGDASVRQTITLPVGKYRLTVGAQNYNQSATTQQCTGAYIFAGLQQTPVYTPADYVVEFTHIGTTVEIGFIAENASGNWLAVDNFRLTLIEELTADALLAELHQQIADAQALLGSMMSAAASAALHDAINTATALTAASATADIQAASQALMLAMVQAQVSIAQYADLQAAIDAAAAVYDATKNGADDLLAEINIANALVANPDATPAELADEIERLATATLLFRVANGSGTAPVVTTHTQFYIPAAHGALIRATISGSNIIERGICWSTEPDPTIADHRSTKYYSQKGTLFHVSDMQPASVFYARPYAITGTYAVGYGEPMKIVTLPVGSCRGTWDEGAPTEDANARCRNAIAETIDYLNEWTAIKGFTLSGHYGAQTPTADCGYGGYMRIGPNAGNQAIGTVIHETGHGVGVGTHWRWYSCADTRENVTYGKWLGSWANKTLQFLENTTDEATFMTGDGTHGWGTNASYDWFVNGADKDKHTAVQYIGGCALLYSLYIDGLCPTTGYPNGVPGYTFQFDESKKYYIKCENPDRGLYDSFLRQRNTTSVAWMPSTDEQPTDSAAWNITYLPQTGYYLFRNVATGKYLTHPATGTSISLKSTSSPSSTEQFQLMPSRADITLGTTDDNRFTASTYWFTWNASNENRAMVFNTFNDRTNVGAVAASGFSYSSTAYNQHFLIISEDQLPAFREAAIATGIHSVSEATASESSTTPVAIYTPDGTLLQHMRQGINIVRYADGTTRKIMVK